MTDRELLREALPLLESRLKHLGSVYPADIDLVARITARLSEPEDVVTVPREDALDAKRYQFRKKFLIDGGAVFYTQRGCRYRMNGELIGDGPDEESAIDAALRSGGRETTAPPAGLQGKEK